MASNKLLPLVLSAKAVAWRVQDANSESADSEFRTVRPRVLERDGNACRFCGFKDKGTYIQVHHRDDDHHNNKMENLVTACMHCHACFHIGLWGTKKEAVIVYLPEIEQWQVSHLCRSIMVAKDFPAKLEQAGGATPDKLASAKRMANAADALMGRLLTERTKLAEDIILTSDPQDLANVLLQMPDQLYERRAERLKGIRLLIKDRHCPGDGAQNVFPGIVQSWMDNGKGKSGPYSGLLPDSWMHLAPLRAG